MNISHIYLVNSMCKVLYSRMAVISCRFYTCEYNFPERSIEIHTIGKFYKASKKKFQCSKRSDLTFNVKFIDTCFDSSSVSKRIPTVLALHGAPGSWKDYVLLTSFLHERGYRVIVPSFPDLHVLKPGIFSHTDLEKAQYIKNFLDAICVSHIDLLVCHSGSVYAALNLCLNDEPTIKSLALLNPTTFNHKAMNASKNLTSLKVLTRASESSVALKLLEIFGPFILKNIMKTPVKVENIRDPILSATTLVRGNISGSKEKFLSVSKKLPVLYIFSENDVLVGAQASYELVELIGGHPSDIFIYNDQGILVKEGTATPRLRILSFAKGSHYVFLKHHEIVNKEISDFLELQKE